MLLFTIYGRLVPYMVKTTVYLTDETALSLREISERRGRPQAELIRDALAAFAAADRPPFPKGLGMFDSGHKDTAANRKHLLRDAARTTWR
jgi:Ribbon-helix-helix protein, copG family